MVRVTEGLEQALFKQFFAVWNEVDPALIQLAVQKSGVAGSYCLVLSIVFSLGVINIPLVSLFDYVHRRTITLTVCSLLNLMPIVSYVKYHYVPAIYIMYLSDYCRFLPCTCGWERRGESGGVRRWRASEYRIN